MAGAKVDLIKGKQSSVFLGFVDEKITEKYAAGVDFTTSKIGGFPDWILNSFPSMNCDVCNSDLTLITQIYAPLEHSSFHRTLYVVACTQPTCWAHPQSWKCFRGQRLDSHFSTEPVQHVSTQNTKPTDWLADADDWGEASSFDDDNGNVQNVAEHFQEQFHKMSIQHQVSSSSDDLSPSIDDPNANQVVDPENSGAEGGDKYSCYVATSEIEVENDQELVDLVAAESPKTLAQYLSENQTTLPEMLFDQRTAGEVTSSSRILSPYFLAVEIEDFSGSLAQGISDHERQLLEEYSLKEGPIDERQSKPNASFSGSDVYEKSIPKHGDVWFHKFKNVIHKNPRQVIRYTRDTDCGPLYLSQPEKQKIPQQCNFCNGPVICELQILPTLIPTLRFERDSTLSTPVEYGSVYVFTCLKSCWDAGDCRSQYKHEQVYLQGETF